MSSYDERSRTAFVFAGGGSFGAIHVGMLHSLVSRGIAADMVAGSSVGALNGAYYAGNPTIEWIQRLDAIWRGLRRSDVFPLTWKTILGFLYRRDFLVTSDALRQLVDENLGYRNLEDAKLPVHIVATDILSGDTVVMSEGPAAQAIIASAAVPAAFEPVHFNDLYLADGAVSSNTPVTVAVARGARRLICSSDRLRLRSREATGWGRRECVARTNFADRTPTNEGVAGPRSQRRLFRCAAAVSADRIAI